MLCNTKFIFFNNCFQIYTFNFFYQIILHNGAFSICLFSFFFSQNRSATFQSTGINFDIIIVINLCRSLHSISIRIVKNKKKKKKKQLQLIKLSIKLGDVLLGDVQLS